MSKFNGDRDGRAAGHPLLGPELLGGLSGLSFRARSLVEGILSGHHRSPHHGASVEFAEHKEYSPGDDLRHVDWKAFARTDKFHVKQFEEETNLRAYLVVDRSSSMGYGAGTGERESKLDRARLLAASVAWLLLRQQDSVGLVLFGEGKRAVDYYLPPRNNVDYLQEMVRSLEGVEPSGHAGFSAVAAPVAELARRRSVIFLFSDLMDKGGVAPLLSTIRQLRSRKHEVVVFHILDPWEISFPFDQVTRFEGLEGEGVVLTDPRGMRAQYREELARWREKLARECAVTGVDLIGVHTGRPPQEALLRLLTGRRRGTSRMSGRGGE